MATTTAQALLASLLLVSCLALSCHAEVLFSSLQRTLEVTASPKAGDVLTAGESEITVTWVMNQSFPSGTDSEYKTIKVKLCYAPVSQVDRAWRKTVDKLKKDKTCQHKIVARPYDSANSTVQSFTWVVTRDVPTASYFVRAYAYNSEDVEVAFGQSTDKARSTNIFQVMSITGRHVSLDIASVCFSAFSVVSLAFFFILEKKKAKRSN